MSQPIAWWVAQAGRVVPKACPHCRGAQTRGRYVVAEEGRSRMVEEYCYACGWCTPIFSQDTAFAIRDHR